MDTTPHCLFAQNLGRMMVLVLRKIHNAKQCLFNEISNQGPSFSVRRAGKFAQKEHFVALSDAPRFYLESREGASCRTAAPRKV